MSPFTAFLTGLSTGGLTCLAIQGGLLLGLLARREGADEKLSRWQRLLLPVSAFLLAKLVIHTLLGFGLGWLGESIQLSTTTRIWLQTLAGVFMIIAGIRLIVPHWLPWLNINAPAALRRLVRKGAKSQALVAPAILGLLTVFIPCGTTQAMEIAAIATASAWQGASIMFAFVLGTAPLFFLVGMLAKGSTLLQRRLTYATSAIVIALGLYTLNGVLILTGSPYEFQNVIRSAQIALTGNPGVIAQARAADDSPVINVYPTGYDPDVVTVPAGRAVTLNLAAQGRLGCTSIFRIPKLKIEKQLTPGSTTRVAVTFPSAGSYTFSCGMGMFRGTINAV